MQASHILLIKVKYHFGSDNKGVWIPFFILLIYLFRD